MSSKKLLIVVAVFATLSFDVGHCQYALQACCDMKLMDSTQQVAIDIGKPLFPSKYNAMRVRFCNTDTVSIQVWTLLDSNTVQLKWKTSYTPTASQNYTSFITVAFDTLLLTADDRLGVYGIISGSNSYWMKTSVPYKFDAIHGATRFTQARFYNSSDLTIGIQAKLENVSWPRTFNSFIDFCTASDCSDWPPESGSTSLPSLPRSCVCSASCSYNSLKDYVNIQSNDLQELSDQINQMSDLLDSLSSSSVKTGYCPSGMQAGSYGIGSCYIVIKEYVELGLAALACQKNWNSNLVEIDSYAEENFLYSIIANMSTSANGQMSFWTSGLYSPQNAQWIWYHQDWTPGVIISQNTYQNWANNFVPRPVNNIDICLVFTADVIQKTTSWQQKSCISPQNYYICELPKACY